VDVEKNSIPVMFARVYEKGDDKIKSLKEYLLVEKI
jgi:hypothetical protein